MEEVTLGEIARKLDRHIEDTKQNNLKQNDILSILLTQSTETKGSIENIKEKQGEHKVMLDMHKTDIDSLKGTKKYYTGAIAIIWILIGFSPFIASLYIKDSVRNVLAEFEIKIQ